MSKRIKDLLKIAAVTLLVLVAVVSIITAFSGLFDFIVYFFMTDM